ncbi:MAG: DUF4240 domain-containing protein [Defluviitaleaceae bacterium]|nr:DUF4240 domain-containing protein [Defluviitaleaceae bacterium]
MDRNKFWETIDKARAEVLKHSDNMEDIMEVLIEALRGYSDEEIAHWGQILVLYKELSYKSIIAAAYYVIDDHLSDDGFDYFRGWLITQGKTALLNALRNPDSILDLNPESEFVWCEGIDYAATCAYTKTTDLEVETFELFDNLCQQYPLPQEEIAAIKSEIVCFEDKPAYTDREPWEKDKELLRKKMPNLCERFM